MKISFFAVLAVTVLSLFVAVITFSQPARAATIAGVTVCGINYDCGDNTDNVCPTDYTSGGDVCDSCDTDCSGHDDQCTFNSNRCVDGNVHACSDKDDDSCNEEYDASVCGSDQICSSAACISKYCGDGDVDDPNEKDVSEVCDGSNLDGETCSSQGYDDGSLSCASNCKSFDFSGCCSNEGSCDSSGDDYCSGDAVVTCSDTDDDVCMEASSPSDCGIESCPDDSCTNVKTFNDYPGSCDKSCSGGTCQSCTCTSSSATCNSGKSCDSNGYSCGGSSVQCHLDGSAWEWDSESTVSGTDEVCGDDYDNDCDGHTGYDDFMSGAVPSGERGDGGDSECPVAMNDASFDGSNFCPGDSVILRCKTSVSNVNGVEASATGDSNGCTFRNDLGTNGWDSQGRAIFQCDIDQGTAGDITGTCSFNTDKINPVSGSETATATLSRDSGCCSAYTDASSCGDTGGCKWESNHCSGNKYYSGADNENGGICISSSTDPSYVCDSVDGAACGAECDADVGCSDYCSGDTRYYSRSCDNTCLCTSGSSEDCNNRNGGNSVCAKSGDYLNETGDDFTCGMNNGYADCEVESEGTILVDEWTCNAANECTEACGANAHTCYRTNADYWRWRSTSLPDETSCYDGYDNDCDGDTDKQDSDCTEYCSNNIDDDGDGFIDEADSDCTDRGYCGDGTCDASESCSGCSSDCGVCDPDDDVCGDDVCGGSESCRTCNVDCGVCNPNPDDDDVCGDGTCGGSESCRTCNVDCGVCDPDDDVCGDDVCGGSESCSSCSSDCGVCDPDDGSQTSLSFDPNPVTRLTPVDAIFSAVDGSFGTGGQEEYYFCDWRGCTSSGTCVGGSIGGCASMNIDGQSSVTCNFVSPPGNTTEGDDFGNGVYGYYACLGSTALKGILNVQTPDEDCNNNYDDDIDGYIDEADANCPLGFGLSTYEITPGENVTAELSVGELHTGGKQVNITMQSTGETVCSIMPPATSCEFEGQAAGPESYIAKVGENQDSSESLEVSEVCSNGLDDDLDDDADEADTDCPVGVTLSREKIEREGIMSASLVSKVDSTINNGIEQHKDRLLERDNDITSLTDAKEVADVEKAFYVRVGSCEDDNPNDWIGRELCRVPASEYDSSSNVSCEFKIPSSMPYTGNYTDYQIWGCIGNETNGDYGNLSVGEFPEECGNEYDDDGDGYTDEADAECDLYFDLEFDNVCPDTAVEASMSSSDYDVYTGDLNITISEGGCGNPAVCKITDPSENPQCTFTSPSTESTYNYYACVGEQSVRQNSASDPADIVVDEGSINGNSFVEGTVTDKEGNPLGNADVTSFYPPEYPTVDHSTFTYSDGKYSFSTYSGSFSLRYAKDEFFAESRKVNLTCDESAEVDVKLREGSCNAACHNWEGRCNSDCQGQTFEGGKSCSFYDTRTISLCDGKGKGTWTRYNQSGNDTFNYVKCCGENAPVEVKKPKSAVTSGSVDELYKRVRIVSDSRTKQPVKIVVNVWQGD